MDELKQQDQFSAEADEQSVSFATEEKSDSSVQESEQAGQEESLSASEQPEQKPPVSKKKQLLTYLICSGIIFAGIYIVQFFNFMRPLFGRVYYGNLREVFFMIACAVFWVPFIIIAFWQIRKRTGIDIFRMGKGEIPLKRSLIIYAIAFTVIFIVSASLGFELKIVKDLGKKVTKITVITNASTYGYNALKLILATFIIELMQEAGELLWADKHKYAKYIPYGGITVAVVYGFTEVIVAYAMNTANVFTWVNIAFYLLFGILYLLCNKRFTITYLVSLLIFIL